MPRSELMGYKKGGRFMPEEVNGVGAALSDALLFTTMCIIGLPVDVYIKDGAVYSGIFHTACVDDEFGEFYRDPFRFLQFPLAILGFLIMGSCCCGLFVRTRSVSASDLDVSMTLF